MLLWVFFLPSLDVLNILHNGKYLTLSANVHGLMLFNLITSFHRAFVGHTSSWSSQHSSSSSSSSHSSGCRRRVARPLTRSHQTSTSTRQEEWWIWIWTWTWIWTSPAQSWTTWGRKASTEEWWNKVQLGMNCVCWPYSKLLFFSDVYWGQWLYSYRMWCQSSVKGVFCPSLVPLQYEGYELSLDWSLKTYGLRDDYCISRCT